MTEAAATMAPGDGETSNWKTSVHIPEVNIGPARNMDYHILNPSKHSFDRYKKPTLNMKLVFIGTTETRIEITSKKNSHPLARA